VPHLWRARRAKVCTSLYLPLNPQPDSYSDSDRPGEDAEAGVPRLCVVNSLRRYRRFARETSRHLFRPRMRITTCPVRGSEMRGTPRISDCANPECNSKFKRLGEGDLVVFPVDDPLTWGVPEHTKQKAVWLCHTCASQMYVRLDSRHHIVQPMRSERCSFAAKLRP
jgi:hypothetical protein